MAARTLGGKETRLERQEREAIQEFGNLVAPSMAASEVLGYVKVPLSSQYRVWLQGERVYELQVSGSRLRELLREDLALEAL